MTLRRLFQILLIVSLHGTSLFSLNNPNNPIVLLDDVGNETVVWEFDTGTTREIQAAVFAGGTYFFATISDPTLYSFGLQYGSGVNTQGTAAWISTNPISGLSSLYAISRFLNGPPFWQASPTLISAATDNVFPDFQMQSNINFGNTIFTWRCVEAGVVKIKARSAGWPMDTSNMSAITTMSPP